MDIENGNISLKLTGHSAPVKHISFSNNKMKNLLTASPVEAILWELTNYTKYFTLNTYASANIQQIMFTPAGDYLVSCFQNDTIQIWRHETMKSVKQIIPSELKHMKSIAFTMNGRAMAMAGLSPLLILFGMDTWKVLKSIDLTKYGINGVQQIYFVPQVFDGGANKILGILSSDCILQFLNVEILKIVYTIQCQSGGIRSFIVSPTGKYFLCILQMGEVNIYNTSCVMDLSQSNKELVDKPCTSVPHKCHKITKSPTPTKEEVEDRMRICMDTARLRRILMQYGEYPDKFRATIWRSLLRTPRNKLAYSALVDKGIHPAYKDIEKQFTIHSSITLKSLKRLLSCLSHWCPLFAVIKFLPGFVFPFVKVLQKDPLLLFECVATVLLNQYQLWFEYAPFPPISILAMVENIVAEHDQPLLDHYCELEITSQTYALKILETAFSEILTCSEWLILWDHILSNEPSFILFAVASYSITQRNAIKKQKTHDQVENFFHNQNPIDKKTFIKKAYNLLNETPEEIHPRNFFNKFCALDKGLCYQQFTGYPKATICLKMTRKDKKKCIKSDRLHEPPDTDTGSEFDSEEVVNYTEIDRGHTEHKYKARQDRKKSKGECGPSNIKDDLINSIIHPVNEEANIKKSHESRSQKKENILVRAESEVKNNKLEKEVERIFFNCNNSETSRS
ncbi:TBC1 domain family member 31 [Leptidea sinapis]|uniref:TBC1 domain family member 31 n=1 Tax=Leptidea sinapis TaxID=189913 RepID=UPI00213F05F1|nr:TBC1 domain family member 31 [Leptidea sinapis]